MQILINYTETEEGKRLIIKADEKVLNINQDNEKMAEITDKLADLVNQYVK